MVLRNQGNQTMTRPPGIGRPVRPGRPNPTLPPIPTTPPAAEEPTPPAAVEGADAILASVLAPYFSPEQIAELLPVLLTEIKSGEQIVEARIFGIIRNTNVYKQRFAGLEQRRANGLSAISEAEYISLERFYRQTMMAAGMPAGFYDQPDDFATLIGRDVSPAEFSQRVQVGYIEVQNAPEDVKNELRVRYGMTDGEMAAFFLDEDKALPLIERQVTTAKLGASAARAGIRAIDTQALERLARMGIAPEQGAQGFARIASDSELYNPLDTGEDAISMDTAVEATFTGNDAAARRIRQRRERRVAEFGGGGGYAGQGAERTGLTSA